MISPCDCCRTEEFSAKNRSMEPWRKTSPIILLYILYIYIYIYLYSYISCFIISHDMSMIFSWSDALSMIFPIYLSIVSPKKQHPSSPRSHRLCPGRNSGNAPWTCAGAWHLRHLRPRRRCRWSRYRSTGALSGSTGRAGGPVDGFNHDLTNIAMENHHF